MTVDAGVLTGDPTLTTAPYEGVEFVRVFTGRVDDYTENPKDGSVDLTCLDDRYLLNGAPTLPAVAASSTGTHPFTGKRSPTAGTRN